MGSGGISCVPQKLDPPSSFQSYPKSLYCQVPRSRIAPWQSAEKLRGGSKWLPSEFSRGWARPQAPIISELLDGALRGSWPAVSRLGTGPLLKTALAVFCSLLQSLANCRHCICNPCLDSKWLARKPSHSTLGFRDCLPWPWSHNCQACSQDPTSRKMPLLSLGPMEGAGGSMPHAEPWWAPGDTSPPVLRGRQVSAVWAF